MKTTLAVAALLLSLAIGAPAFAESYRIEWNPVTKYSDGSPLETGKAVTYTAYWTTDPTLQAASLKPIVTDVGTTAAIFDPAAAGMKRGSSVYFTCRSTLSSGEVSDLSPGISWPVPRWKPSSPGNPKIIRIP